MHYKALRTLSLIVVMSITGVFTTLVSAQDNIPETETPTPIASETTVSPTLEPIVDTMVPEVIINTATTEPTSTTVSTSVVPEFLQSGKYDDRDPRITYTGSWKQRKVMGIFRSTESYTTTKGSSFSFTFEGTRLLLLFTKNKGYGNAIVNIDGNNVATIKQAAKKAYKNKTWVSSSLEPFVPHQVTVTFTQGKQFNIDAILIQNSAATPTKTSISATDLANSVPLSVGVYDDLDPRLAYNGRWLKHGISKLFMDTESYSDKLGSSVSVKFQGKSISLMYRKHTFFGDVKVTIDGVSYGTIKQYQAWESRNGLWTSSILDDTNDHIAVFTHATGKYMSVDAIVVNGIAPEITTTVAPTQLPTATTVPTQLPTATAPTQLPTAITIPTQVMTATFVPTQIPATSTPTSLPQTPIPTNPPPTNVPTSIVEPTETMPVTTETPIVLPTATFTPTSMPTLPATSVFYIDSVGGSDTNSGISTSAAWKSLSQTRSRLLSPGTVIYIKRGSSFTGSIVIDDSGTAANPITFTTYGSGAKPVFENPGSQSNKTRGITVNADYVVLDGFLVRNTQDAGIYISTGSDYVTVKNMEITNTGIGVTIRGEGGKILNNHIHDLHMVNNTSGGDDDYGANGVLVSGTSSNGEIAYNTIVNCKATSYDYGVDGGTVEFYGTISNYKIHHNYAEGSQGFLEIGSGATGTVANNVISYNIMYNNARPLGAHLSGGFGAVVEGLKFENNTIVDVQTNTSTTAINFYSAAPTTSTFIMRNNIFYLTNYSKVASSSTFTHDHNLFFFNGKTTSLGFTLGTGESIANPSFINLSIKDFKLLSASPAIDKGIVLGYNKDYSNYSVPNGGSPDIGSHEFQH